GKFIEGVDEFSGRFVKNYKDDPKWEDVNVDICVKLKKENRAFKIEKYEHTYPHCWRTDKPILYYPLDAWFIKTTAVKDRMVELNKTIQWKPASTGEGRFGNWLENMVDWNLSRSRFWGTPLAIWRTADGDEEKCIGSISELLSEIEKSRERLGDHINAGINEETLDLHKPQVDQIILVSSQGKEMTRIPDLVDVWFDSGSMPYAQWHYPFENKDRFIKNFPADFIAEGVDQTRGWFYTLHAIAVMLFDSVAYKTVVSNGLVLDKNGNKMSKRVGNVVDPFNTIDQYGADATRWYLITNASPWDSMKFDPEGIKEVQRKFFGTLYNTYQFFALYANVDGFSFKESYIPIVKRPEIDKWVLSSLNTLVSKVVSSFDDYEPTVAGRLIEDFVDEELSNWYVRLSRRRFWKGEYEDDKRSAYQTLYECLETISRLIAPVSPFFAEWLFQNLNKVTERSKYGSVHFTDYPEVDDLAIDKDLEERMKLAQDVSSLILSIRKKINVKVRQPLKKALIPVLNPVMKEQLEKVSELIRSEVNIKEIEYLAADNEFIHKKIKPNFVLLGKKLGAKMKLVTAALANFNQNDINKLEKEGKTIIQAEGDYIEIAVNEVEISSEDLPGWMVATKGPLTVALDVTVTPELEREGNARELVNRIQKIRKDQEFDLTDRINVQIGGAMTLEETIREFNYYICAEILADKLDLVANLTNGTLIEVNDVPLTVFVTKKA
ncbi:MAG TPA: class I tRNA ligase family protein, partial [Puia sp.]|nr:class I tRNA ligase family protein [Puia sp.]